LRCGFRWIEIGLSAWRALRHAAVPLGCHFFNCFSRRGRSSMIFRRCLSFIFFQVLHSSRVRMQPMQKPVLLSNLQMSMQGDAMLMTDSHQ
jgi:hypothetical protein